MPRMTTKSSRWWSKRRFSCLSLLLSLANVGIIWGPIALAHAAGEHHIPSISRVADLASLLSIFASFALAVAALVADPDRIMALFSVVIACFSFYICGIPMFV
jgi:hypothetical protein